MTTTVTAQIQLRKGTAAAWTSADPTLASGEIGYETDTGKQKMGDGTTAWTDLAYYYDPAVSGGATDHGALTGLSDDDHSQYHTDARGDARYAPVAKGVTNGDSHDHSGGDGAQISYSTLSNLPTLGTAAATAATDYAVAAKGVTNGDSHDHNGGDGGQIAYSSLSSLPTLGTAAATAATDYATAAHAHGNLTNAGAIGSTANLPVITGASGVLAAGAFGTGATDFCVGNDARLSDARTPSAHSHEGTAILSTGEAGGTKYLREDGDGTCSWQTPAGGGDLVDDATPQLGGDLDLNGSQITGSGGTVTTSQPIIDVSQTWNDVAVTFTGIKANITDTASAAASLLLDLQVGGSSNIKVTKDGKIIAPDATSGSTYDKGFFFNNGGSTSLGFVRSASNYVSFVIGTTPYYSFQSSLGFQLHPNSPLSWATTSSSGAANLSLFRDANNTLAQRLTTNPQTFRLYNTWTDASNYERLAFTWDSNVAKIQTEAAGTGTLRDLSIGSTSGKLGFLGATPVARAAHVVDADTAHALNATFSDTEVESALNALATKLNSILKTLEDFGLHATS